MVRERTVTVYTRDGCHLCEDAIATVRRVGDSVPQNVILDVIDVDSDERLRANYGERVPYVLIDGHPRFKYRVDDDELRACLTDEPMPESTQSRTTNEKGDQRDWGNFDA